MSLDGVLIAVVIVLSVGTAASVVVPSLHVRVVAPSLDLVLDTLATVVTLAVALLGWARFREQRGADGRVPGGSVPGPRDRQRAPGRPRDHGPRATGRPGPGGSRTGTALRVHVRPRVRGGAARPGRHRIDPHEACRPRARHRARVRRRDAAHHRARPGWCGPPAVPGVHRRARAAGQRTGRRFAAPDPDTARCGDAGARRGVVPVGGRPVTTAVSPRPEDRRRIPGDRSRLRGVRPGRRRGLSECLHRARHEWRRAQAGVRRDPPARHPGGGGGRLLEAQACTRGPGPPAGRRAGARRTGGTRPACRGSCTTGWHRTCGWRS